MRRIISLLFLIVCSSAAAAIPAKPERHVVVVVWDGMRPDFVTEQNTPTLWKLARDGITFRNHHAVYPSHDGKWHGHCDRNLSRQERYHCEPCLSAGHRSSPRGGC